MGQYLRHTFTLARRTHYSVTAALDTNLPLASWPHNPLQQPPESPLKKLSFLHPFGSLELIFDPFSGRRECVTNRRG